MKLIKIGMTAVILLVASVATLSADDKDKEKEKRPAPPRAAAERERPARAAEPAPSRPARTPEAAPNRPARAPEAAPARTAPAPNYNPPARQERPAYSAPSRQESGPAAEQPGRQDRSPAFNPPSRQESRQETSPSTNSPARQTQVPSYSPQNNRPAPTTQYGPGTQANQPGANAPGNTGGGWRQVERNGASNGPVNGPGNGPSSDPRRGNVGSQPVQSGPGAAAMQGGPQRQSGPADARRPQVGGGGIVRLPPGQTRRSPDGSAVHVANDGRTIHLDPRGRVTTVEVRGGGQVHYAPSGRPDRVVTRSGAVIINRPGGVRQIVIQRPGQVVIVTNPRGQGYIQRPFEVRGHQFYQRTYYAGGRPYVNVYRPYFYHGAYYPYYVPMRYYRPAYYGWAFAPFGRPVIFSWGWGAAPWYGYYGPYFAPYPAYRSPLFWLTDFLFAATLQAAYDQRMADNAAAAREAHYEAQEAMRPEVKQMVADEVQRQLAAERADAQNSGGALQDAPRDTLPGIFNDGASHALVVHNPLQVDDGAQGCALTEGDVIGYEGNLTPGVETATARVLASHGQDCATGSTVTVGLQDILDMQNHLRETIDRGLGEMQTKSRSGGLPAPPTQAMGAPTPSAWGSQVPQPDANAATELSQQAQQATQGEQEVLQEAPPLETDGGNGGSSDAQQPPTVTLGMTMSQVQSLLGTPRRIVDLGPKKMYVYEDMKVIFMEGRVSDVQ